MTRPNDDVVFIDDLEKVKQQRDELAKALEESVKLQSHYAELLNMYDGGKRMTFTAESWLAKLAS